MVSFVLFILTFFLLEFIENYHVDEAEADLTKLASKVAVIMETIKTRRQPDRLHGSLPMN
ncbi:hypothetical protein PO124_32295 [Bacillus licheniformis]|nr:hypothetical protein [Bacillus licheniformis]